MIKEYSQKIAFLILIIILLPSVSMAEVSDKVATIPQLWVQSVLIAGLGFFSSRYRIWLGVILLPVTLLLCIGTLQIIYEPFIGPAIRKEQGSPYIVTVYGSSLLMVIAHAAGFWKNIKKRKSI